MIEFQLILYQQYTSIRLKKSPKTNDLLFALKEETVNGPLNGIVDYEGVFDIQK